MNLILTKLKNMDEQNIFEIRKREKITKSSVYILKIDSNKFLISNTLIEFFKKKDLRNEVLEFTLEEISRLIERKLSTKYEFMGIYNPNFPKKVK
ncbi:MAG: hypothetical protein ACRC8M_02955 [Cetobacterium sp.]|uniref:hypothetical protein n=1 Tax=Cetobacterium sp. TaxID=2071632 RepID=UPI003F384FE0